MSNLKPNMCLLLCVHKETRLNELGAFPALFVSRSLAMGGGGLTKRGDAVLSVV